MKLIFRLAFLSLNTGFVKPSPAGSLPAYFVKSTKFIRIVACQPAPVKLNVCKLPRMKKLNLIILFISLAARSQSQYYYKDILNAEQLQKDLKTLKENKVRSISIKSFENDGSPSEGFFCEKNISKDFSRTELFTRSDISAASLLTSFFDKSGRITGTVDSSKLATTKTYYEYNAAGKISKIRSEVRSSDDDFTSEIVEERLYSYDDSGKPAEMKKVKNRKDTLIILFKSDEHGNLAIEKDTKTGSKYYYYYNDQNQLTDIVFTQEFRDKLTPQYSFEYNSAGLVSQMSTSAEGGGDYMVWKYRYDNGLRTSEKCFLKGRQLLGSVEYEYKN
jgi:hypothetical protein